MSYLLIADETAQKLSRIAAIVYCSLAVRGGFQKTEVLRLFAHRIVDDFFVWSNALHGYFFRSRHRAQCILSSVLPETVTTVIVIKLIDYDVLKLSAGRHAADDAMRALITMMRASIRPGDIGIAVGNTEYLIGLEGKPHVASRVASRLLAKSARIALADNSPVVLSPLNVVAGVTATLAGEVFRSAYARALDSVIQPVPELTAVLVNE